VNALAELYLFRRFLCDHRLVMDLSDHNYPAVFQAVCPWVDLAAQELEDSRLVDLVVMVDNNNLVEVAAEPDSKLSPLDKCSVLEWYNNHSKLLILNQILLRKISPSFNYLLLLEPELFEPLFPLLPLGGVEVRGELLLPLGGE